MRKLLDTFSKTATAHILAITFVWGCFIMLYIMMIKEIPAPNVSTVNQAVGLLFGCLAFIMGYFYGASKAASTKKTTDD